MQNLFSERLQNHRVHTGLMETAFPMQQIILIQDPTELQFMLTKSKCIKLKNIAVNVQLNLVKYHSMY